MEVNLSGYLRQICPGRCWSLRAGKDLDDSYGIIALFFRAAVILRIPPDIRCYPMAHKRHPVIILGGGPAGAATAMYLLRHGITPVIVERDHHPRYHVGESL